MKTARTFISLFHTDPITRETKELKFPFDLIKKVSVSIDLTVCTSDTIRGRNKTDHSYRNQNKITISGSFGERAKEMLGKEFFNYGQFKIKNIQELFTSFVKDIRLFYIYTRFKTYKNYALTGSSFTYASSASGIDVELTFVEVMFRNNEDLYLDYIDNNYRPPILYSPPLTDALIEREVPVKEIVYQEKTVPEEKVSGDKKIVEKYNRISSKSSNNSGIFRVMEMQ